MFEPITSTQYAFSTDNVQRTHRVTETAAARYCCWIFLVVVLVLVVVDAVVWFPGPRAIEPLQPRESVGYGWAAIVLAVVYALVAVGFVWVVDDGVDIVFALSAVVVFAFAGVTISVSARSTEDAGGWVVVVFFCLLIFAFLIACGHAAWRWRGQMVATKRARWTPPPSNSELGDEGKDGERLPPLVRLVNG